MSDVNIKQLTPGAWLVFGGLKWRPLIGSGLSGKSQKEAEAVKATHYVAAGSHSAAVGTIQLPKESSYKPARKLYSAAAIFAISHQNGAMISRENMGDGMYWVVGCHDGMVSKGTDVICTEAEADEIVIDLKNRYENATEVTDSDVDPTHYLNETTQLLPVKSMLQKVPTSAKVVVCVLLCVMLIDSGWGYWKKYQMRKLREQNIEQYVDAHAEWAAALDDWAKSVKLDGQSGLQTVYSSMGQIPPDIGGWKLSVGECKPGRKGWSCTARYKRTVLGTNATFLANLPEGWTATWGDLTTAIGNWEIQTTRKQLSRPALTPVAQFNVNYISKLQRVLFSYRLVTLLEPAKVAITAPTVVQVTNGKTEVIPIPYPQENTKGIEIPSKQAFTFTGPLRSLSILPLIDDAVITSLKVEVETRAVEPSLRDSIYMATMTGDFYVQ